ncbi:MAG: phosphodiester glycosidase family protein [Candidatus Marinimicrobia bacterium]|nr:phosphodiester glycosidase family protein [Candidatus Neomarinimicrobiota bacterium]
MKNLALIILVLVIFISSCARNGKSFSIINMTWEIVESTTPNFPAGIKIMKGRNDELPINAWAAIIDPRDPNVDLNVIVSEDIDRRETLTQFSQNKKARVVVNGGYFLIDKTPTEHVGLLYVNNRTVAPATKSVLRNNKRYFTARGAVGFLDDGGIDIAWVTSRNDSLFNFPEPLENQPEEPVDSFDFSKAETWEVDDAIHAGPVLMHDGKIRVTSNEEVFFGSTIPDIHPRTAAGYRNSGELVLLVVDGRQVDSRGVDLQELAILMRDLGCVEAINLDGGGSSAMVVDGKLLNRPAGTTSQREVMSAIAVSVN